LAWSFIRLELQLGERDHQERSSRVIGGIGTDTCDFGPGDSLYRRGPGEKVFFEERVRKAGDEVVAIN